MSTGFVNPNVMVPRQGTLSDLQAWLAGDLSVAVARLYASPTPYDPANTCLSYVESSFVGYIPNLIGGWTPPVINANGAAQADSDTTHYQFTGGAGNAVAYGMYVTDLALTKLLLVLPFDSPFVFTPRNNVLDIVIQLAEISEL